MFMHCFFSIDCPQVCIEIYAPVCGSDLKTYSNECHLQIEACENNSDLHKLYDGMCNESSDPATSTTTGSSATTKRKKKTIFCTLIILTRN